MCQKNEGGPSRLLRRSISRRSCYKRMQISLIWTMLRETFYLPHALVVKGDVDEIGIELGRIVQASAYLCFQMI